MQVMSLTSPTQQHSGALRFGDIVPGDVQIGQTLVRTEEPDRGYTFRVVSDVQPTSDGVKAIGIYRRPDRTLVNSAREQYFVFVGGKSSSWRKA